MQFLSNKLKLRIYQQTILASAVESNSLVVIPTGLGKTFIAIALAGLRIKKGQVVVMAPTKPLCVQHQKTFSKFFSPRSELIVLTGEIPPAERKKLWNNKLIFATPQTVENDILRGIVNLEKISLIVFDEAHRAMGDYAYTWIAQQYTAKNKEAKILALTASPASEKEKIQEVCQNLFINKLEVKQETDADVDEYVQHKEIMRIDVELPEEILEIKTLLENVLKLQLRRLRSLELIKSVDIRKVRKVELLKMQGQLAKQASEAPNSFLAISILARTIKIMHALELLQTQGIYPLYEFFKKVKQQSNRIKASKNLMEDWNFKKAMLKTHELIELGIEHPKFDALKKLVLDNITPKARIIIFTQYRSSVDKILKLMNDLKGIRPVKFIGQKEGMTQKKQVEVLERFRDGVFNVLVATSISEEGLHIENADLGVFFEPVPSALRSIQRRGRIGRVNFGKVYVLVTIGTLDESYYWVAYHKERRMKDILKELKEEVGKSKQSRLDSNG